MIYHIESFFQIAFGDIRFQFNPQEFRDPKRAQSLLSYKPFDQLKRSMKIKRLVFLHQVHGNDGLAIRSIDQASEISAFSCDGDYLITNISSVGLAIASADCLPIILYSSSIPIVGIVHAGWRGSIKKVAVFAVRKMEQEFGVQPSTIRVFFGPSGKTCCYKFGPEISSLLDSFSYRDEVIKKIGNELFFDVPYFNQLQLQEIGILPSSFHRAYNECTICDASFCSYRREKKGSRQFTVVSLK